MPVKLTVSTNQEAFNAAVEHLKNMKERSMSNGKCHYGGTHCAVGALLDHPDDVENLSINSLVRRGSVDIGDVSVNLLQDLQAAHDISDNWWGNGFMNWEYLRALAKSYRLDDSVVPD